jgi:hypothetical protein
VLGNSEGRESRDGVELRHQNGKGRRCIEYAATIAVKARAFHLPRPSHDVDAARHAKADQQRITMTLAKLNGRLKTADPATVQIDAITKGTTIKNNRP